MPIIIILGSLSWVSSPYIYFTPMSTASPPILWFFSDPCGMRGGVGMGGLDLFKLLSLYFIHGIVTNYQMQIS